MMGFESWIFTAGSRCFGKGGRAMNQRFDGKVVVVTGGGRGIGRAVAAGFLKEGATVILAERQQETALATAGELSMLGLVHGRVVDIADERQVSELADWLRSEFGAIHGLINNAGFGISGSIDTLTMEQWDTVMNTNLRGAFLTSQRLTPLLEKGAPASIIHIASTRAVMSEPDTFPYSASKGGLRALTHSMAVSLGPRGIRVNSISPGWIHTGEPEILRSIDHSQHPVGRVGNPDDIAEACLFLASDKAGFITGTDLTVDGGMTVKMIYAD